VTGHYSSGSSLQLSVPGSGHGRPECGPGRNSFRVQTSALNKITDTGLQMRPTEVRAVILELGHDARLDFQQKAGRITAELNTCSTKGVLEHLDSAGVIPEEFDHDSTEEKLFAKYCDALLADRSASWLKLKPLSSDRMPPTSGLKARITL